MFMSCTCRGYFLAIFFYLFFGCAGPSLLRADFSLVAVSVFYSLVAVRGLLIAVASLIVGAQALGHTGFSSCGAWA